MDLQSIKQRFEIIGNSPLLNNALRIAVQVATTDLPILLIGESGVGKEVFSKIVHQFSNRKHNPFIAVNCGAIPEGTIDSELFGHEKGSFTGANDARKGYFEFVKEGSIFLDEVSEMPLGTQARLLRVLETGEYIKVGSSSVQKTDVRVVTATNKDLQELVSRGKFREDLYYRLNTIPIHIPSLRERKEDIQLLFRKFSTEFAEKYHTDVIEINEGVKDVLTKYRWPGNIRQLKNVAEQLSAISVNKNITTEELLNYVPDLQENKLPVLSTMISKEHESYSDREMLYRILFEMREDVNYLKQVLADVLQGTMNNDQLNDKKDILIRGLKTTGIGKSTKKFSGHGFIDTSEDKPVILTEKQIEEYNETEVVEESLSIAEKEKELILKALDKHKGRRKDAALDLGISERTLYRKIKEYDINE